MTLQQIFNNAYLSARAEQVIKDSLEYLKDEELRENADLGLTIFESAGAPVEILDRLYLASL